MAYRRSNSSMSMNLPHGAEDLTSFLKVEHINMQSQIIIDALPTEPT